MSKKGTRKRYESPSKARVALAALRDDKTLSELATELSVHGNLISQWKKRLQSNVSRVFEEPTENRSQDHHAVVEELQRDRQLHVELDWLKKKLPSSVAERRRWITPDDGQLNIAQQCRLLGLPRSTYYRAGVGESAENLRLAGRDHSRKPHRVSLAADASPAIANTKMLERLNLG